MDVGSERYELFGEYKRGEKDFKLEKKMLQEQRC